MSTSAKERHAAKGYEEFAAPGILRWTSEITGQELPVWLDLELMGKSTLSAKGESLLVSLQLLAFVRQTMLERLLRVS